MSNIYTSIDIGSYSIKIVVLQKVGNKFNTLATTSVRSRGIERGRVINEEDLIKSIKSAIDSVSNIIGIKIDKVLLAISAKDAIMDIIPAQVDITNDKVSGDDISNLLRDAVSGQSFVKNELVTAFPIKFKVDGPADDNNDKNNTFEVCIYISNKDFIEKAKENRFIGVNGHRLVGGCRISLYNAVTIDACKAVAQFMEAYRKDHQ